MICWLAELKFKVKIIKELFWLLKIFGYPLGNKVDCFVLS